MLQQSAVSKKYSFPCPYLPSSAPPSPRPPSLHPSASFPNLHPPLTLRQLNLILHIRRFLIKTNLVRLPLLLHISPKPTLILREIRQLRRRQAPCRRETLPYLLDQRMQARQRGDHDADIDFDLGPYRDPGPHPVWEVSWDRGRWWGGD
jgi:hypothetical protein